MEVRSMAQMQKETPKRKKRRGRLRIELILLVWAVVILLTFLAYMASTSLEDVLERERGEGVIITHSTSDKADDPEDEAQE